MTCAQQHTQQVIQSPLFETSTWNLRFPITAGSALVGAFMSGFGGVPVSPVELTEERGRRRPSS